MIRIVTVTVLLLALALSCTSCMDQEPGEVTVRTMQGGQPLNAVAMIFNDKGVQIKEDATMDGFTRIADLKPGTYYVKIKTSGETPTIYKAIRKFTIRTADSKVLDIDVDDDSSNPTDAPASLGGTAPAS
jgi:hypothetical protein